MVVVELPVASALPLSIGLGFEVGTVAAAVNLVGGTTGPHLLFMGLRDRGPPASSWAGRPRSGCESKGPVGRWANWWRSTQHSPS